MTHTVSMAAVDAAADARLWPEHGEPWQVAKVYYQLGFHRARFAALDDAMAAAGLERPYAARLANWPANREARQPTTFIPAADFFEVRNAALRAHATQIDPEDRFWFAVPVEVERSGWPTEDFQLARSQVPTSLPESDLFAGLRDQA